MALVIGNGGGGQSTLPANQGDQRGAGHSMMQGGGGGSNLSCQLLQAASKATPTQVTRPRQQACSQAVGDVAEENNSRVSSTKNNSKNNKKVAVINLMGNVFMKKCDDVFIAAKNLIEKIKLKKDADFIVVDMHGEITSEKMAIGHVFDGSATFVVGTHTHVPTNDGRVLDKGTAYLTDAGMCGDYNSVIGMSIENSINRFYKRDSVKHFPAEGEASLCGAIIEANPKNGLALNISQFIFGGQLQKDN